MSSRFIPRAIFALPLASLLSVAVQPAYAADIGGRVYVQPWTPTIPAQDQVTRAVDYPSIVSDSVKKAWDAGKSFVSFGIYKALNGYRVADGIYLYGAAGKLNEVTDFSLRPAGADSGTLQFVVPNATIVISASAKAVEDADKYTAGLASVVVETVATPVFTIGFDLQLKLTLSVAGNAVQATDVHAVVQHPSVTADNDPAKAMKAVSDISSFFGGPDFIKMIEDKLNNMDLGSASFLGSINEGLGPINQGLQAATANTGFVLVTMWADHNRLTFYFAPLPVTNPPTDGKMTGNIHWDPKAFPTANCFSFGVYTDVQTGPRPLEDSEGLGYGEAPTKRVGRFSAISGRSGLAGSNSGSCDYTVADIAAKWFHKTSATTNAAPAKSVGSNNALVGNLHNTASMLPVGWSGLSIIPDPVATNKDYQLIEAMTGAQGLGNPRQVMPGQKEEGIRVYGVDPAVRIRQQEGQMQGTPAAPVIVNQRPMPPVENVPRQPEGRGTANNAQSQAPQPAPPSQQAAPGHATAPSQVPNSERPGRTRIMDTEKASETVTPGAKSSINPQPLPPKVLQEPAKAATASSGTLRPGSRVMINPQPLPPKEQNGTNGIR